MIFWPDSTTATELAADAPLLVDVEFWRGRSLFALAQGYFPKNPDGSPAPGDGSPALPNTGQLVKVNLDGTLTVISEELKQPTSKEIIQNSAYIFTFGGEIWKIDNIESAHFGMFY